MTSTRTVRTRAVAATAAFAIALSTLAGGILSSSAAAPVRSATPATDTTYLADTLGLPLDTVVETVTYDRFQWLLGQAGQYAFLIGSTTDAGFAAEAAKADLAAKASGATKVYWFDPNLSGYTGIRNLDVRNTAGLNLATATQTAFSKVWQNVIGQYLGNGISSVPSGTRTSVTIAADDTVINDFVDPLFDFRSSGTLATASTDNLFFVYDKDHASAGKADKIVSWANLTTAVNAQTAVADALTAAGGGAVIDQLSQFSWWKDSANAKHDLAYADDARYGGNIIDDTDNADGWRIKQITYPELLHLLNQKDSADKNFVILFGGTWCHNTRAVIKFINEEAQKNDVATVYNFDLVLDGGTVNGTNGAANPIHVRNNANSGATFNFRPSYIYGDVVRTYLQNLVTEYDPNTGTAVSYYPGGDLTAFPTLVRRLQVPFLINYQRGTGANPATNSIKRQWIQQLTDPSTGLANFREYMSEWWFTQPSSQLGLPFAIPADETTLSAGDQLLLAQARAGAAFGAQARTDLVTFFAGLPGPVVSTQEVSAPSVTYGQASKITLNVTNAFGRVPTGNATLSIGGSDYPVAVSGGAAEFNLTSLAPGSYPFSISYVGDSQIAGFTKTGTLEVGRAAVSKLAGSVAKAPTTRAAGKFKVNVTAPSGLAQATGSVRVTLTKGKVTKRVTATLSAGVVNVALPKLAKGQWKVQVAYLGDANYATKNAAAAAINVK